MMAAHILAQKANLLCLSLAVEEAKKLAVPNVTMDQVETYFQAKYEPRIQNLEESLEKLSNLFMKLRNDLEKQ